MFAETPLPLVGPSSVMRALAARADDLVRDVSRPVMVIGPRGVGKRFLAQRIHLASSLATQPLAVFDARRSDEVVLRALLDTAAPKTTVLVRHVDQLSATAQALLDQRSAEGDRVVRLLATTTADIVALVTERRFLDALYYRLFAWPMTLPALADRDASDLRAVAESLLTQMADDDTSLPTVLDDAAAADLAAFAWPDNLREFEATVALAQLRARGAPAIGRIHVHVHDAEHDAPPSSAPLSDVERWHLLRVLQECGGNRTHAARRLGISRMTLITKLKLFSDGTAS